MSGMPACQRRTRYRGHDSHVRHAGMPAPDEIQSMIPTSGMPACRCRRRSRKHECDLRHAGAEEIQGNIVDVAMASGFLLSVK